ncbi:bladder cancer associated transcript 1 isoform X1 [Oenanthe melanoleuca]|uniref:bladder cancer associated transcript 1 isoform X1 n=1 Tax=Oenanthe melanoleuca TaxID=2939378 RepID=UPI0024C1C31B|nr:bladder cancer associated transcript 1 isoform X1 [Oenanthe melanoleuca]
MERQEIIYAAARLGAAGGPAPAGWEGGRPLPIAPSPAPSRPQPHTASQSPSQLGRHLFSTARAFVPSLLRRPSPPRCLRSAPSSARRLLKLLCRIPLPKESLESRGSPGVSPEPLLLRVMPQFTFACFCGLHGFCKMKRKKEEAGGGQETAV